MTACRAGPSRHPRAAGVARAGTSARASARTATRAGRRKWARAGDVSPGVFIAPTASVAGAADGGTPTIPAATANTAVVTRPLAKGTLAGCAWSRPAWPKNRDGPRTWPGPINTASSCSWPTCASKDRALPGSSRHTNGPRGDQCRRGSSLWNGGNWPCSKWTQTPGSSSPVRSSPIAT
jgi:hypothetical protein